MRYNSCMFLAIKTSEDPAEIYLLDESGAIFAKKVWDAGRTLAKNLLGEIEKLVRENCDFMKTRVTPSAAKQSTKNSQIDPQNKSENEIFANLSGIIVFRGPGSFTGLRIGVTVANALAYAQNLPIVGAENSQNQIDWLKNGFAKLQKMLENGDENSRENFVDLVNDADAKTSRKTKLTEENGVKFRDKNELIDAAKLQIIIPEYGAAPHITRPKK